MYKLGTKEGALMNSRSQFDICKQNFITTTNVNKGKIF